MPNPPDPHRHVKFDKKEHADGKRPKAEFKLSEQSHKDKSTLWVVLGLVAGVVLAGYAAMAWARQPDPHFLMANKLVHDYEIGRAVASRNYNNPIYKQAIGELDLVDPDSISAEPAAELRNEIEQGIGTFLTRTQTRRQDSDKSIEKRRLREANNHKSHRRHVVIPEKDYEECDHEESGREADHE
jgi:hypothetical protein